MNSTSYFLIWFCSTILEFSSKQIVPKYFITEFGKRPGVKKITVCTTVIINFLKKNIKNYPKSDFFWHNCNKQREIFIHLDKTE